MHIQKPHYLNVVIMGYFKQADVFMLPERNKRHSHTAGALPASKPKAQLKFHIALEATDKSKRS